MTGMLASINSLEEAQLILNTSVDIIDLKQPERGALGALDTETVAKIVRLVNQQKPVSATVGDLPMQAMIVYNAVKTMVTTGVDYIKIGFFPGGDWQATLDKLSTITQQGYQLIAVLFADSPLDMSVIQLIKKSGFSGVMLDTMDKSQGSLLQIMDLSEIQTFVSAANNSKLLCGLAGSLKEKDIQKLLHLDIDYLGFRGALCDQHDRIAKLDSVAIKLISAHFKRKITA